MNSNVVSDQFLIFLNDIKNEINYNAIFIYVNYLGGLKMMII